MCVRVCEMETTTFMTFSFHSSPASHSFLSLKPVNPSTDAAESVNDLNRIKQNEQNCSAHPVRRSIIIVRNQSTVSVSVLALEGFAFLHLLAGLYSVWQVETDVSPFKQFNTRGLLNQVNAYE